MKWTSLIKLLALPSVSLVALASSCQNNETTQSPNPFHDNTYAKAFANEANVFINNYTKMQNQIVDFILQQSKVNPALRDQIQLYRTQKPSSFNKYFLPFAENVVKNDNIFKTKYQEFESIYNQTNLTSYALAQAMNNFVSEVANECNEMLTTLNEYFDIQKNFSYNLEYEFANVRATARVYYINSIYQHLLNNLTTLESNKAVNLDQIQKLKQTIDHNLKQFKQIYSIQNSYITIDDSFDTAIELDLVQLEKVVEIYKKDFGPAYLASLDINKSNSFTDSFSSMNNQMKILVTKSQGNLEADYLFINPEIFKQVESELDNTVYLNELTHLKQEGYNLISNYIIDDLSYDKKVHLKSNLHNNVQFDIALAQKHNGKFVTVKNLTNSNFGSKLSTNPELDQNDYLVRLQVNQSQLKSLGISLISILQNQVFNANGNIILSQPENLVASLTIKENKPTITLAYKDKNYVIPAGWDTVLYPNKNIALSYNFPHNVSLSIFDIYLKVNKTTYDVLTQLKDNDTFDLEFI
ncbi:hypothetical protein [Mycoplasma sp. CR]|uniref:hypothetical protein n=1 Tax=Mycoplasma sp. CR TaxID=3401693 RepID=UPI003AAC0B6A